MLQVQRIQGIQETQRDASLVKTLGRSHQKDLLTSNLKKMLCQIVFSKDSFHNNKHGQSSNIMFDEIEQTKALGDLLLSNKAGLRYTVQV